MSAITFTDEMYEVISTIRALAITRKEPTTEKQMHNEYYEINGETIPYKKFGFRNLEHFLKESNEFIIGRGMSGMTILPRPTKESAHIASMVQRQKTTKKKRSIKASFRNPRSSSDQSWQKASYSNMCSQTSSPRKSMQSLVNRYARTSARYNTNNNNYSYNYNNNSAAPKKYNTSAIGQRSNYGGNQTGQSVNYNNNVVKSRTPAVSTTNYSNPAPFTFLENQDVRYKGKPMPAAPVTVAVPKQSTKVETIPKKVEIPQVETTNVQEKKLSPSNGGGSLSTRLCQPIKEEITRTLSFDEKSRHSSPPQNEVNDVRTKSKPQPSSPRSKQTKGISTQPVLPQYNPQSEQTKIQQSVISQQPVNTQSVTPSAKSSSKLTVQNRLKIVKSLENEAVKQMASMNFDTISIDSSFDLPEQSSMPQISMPTTPITPPVLEVPIDMQPCDALQYYCRGRGYTAPEYKCFKVKSDIGYRYQCKVTVNAVAYSTYPMDYLTENEARIAAARVVIDVFKMEDLRNMYPVCMDSDCDIAIKIFQILKDYANGVFKKNFQQIFQSMYEQSLPDHWFELILNSRNLFVTEGAATDTCIMFAVTTSSNSSCASEDGVTVPVSPNTTTDKLQLPWHAEHWNLVITNPISTTEVWARLIGPDYSDKLESLSTDIEMSLLTDKVRTQTIEQNKVYLVSISECWSRVRVDQLISENNLCKCFLVDYGDEEWLPMDQLYVCEPRFLQFPQQAIQLSLYGLEDFDENPNARTSLDTLVARVCVAKILTKQEEYETDDGSANFESSIKVVLYDTTSDEDINLNPVIMQSICENTPTPQINRVGVTHICITHVMDNGLIWCQVKDAGVHYIEKLIYSLCKSKINDDIHRGLYKDKSLANQFYLYYDERSKIGYRVSIAKYYEDTDEYLLFYVDYGWTKRVKTCRMLRLDSLSSALHRFPPQAICFGLYGLPEISENVVARLKGLLKPSITGVVKMCNPTGPLVILYTRSPKDGVLFNVNENIRMETELENLSEEISPNSSSITNGYRSPSNDFLSSSSSSPSLTNGLTKTAGQANVSLNSDNDGSVANKSFESNASSLNDLSMQLRNFDINKSPQRNVATTAVSVASSAEKRQIEDYVVPKVGELFDILVLMASNPSYFVVQPHKDALQLRQLMSDLQTYCATNTEFLTSDMLEIGEVYAAIHSNDNSWYRATVINIIGSTMIHVFFCDYGDVKVLSCDKLKILPDKFRSLPRHAIRAKLHGIEPKHGDWTVEDCIYFQNLTVNKIFYSTVNAITMDDICPDDILVELTLIDTSGPVDLYINKKFIEDGRASAIQQ